MRHTRKDAEYCLWYFKKHINENAELIGSFGKGAEFSEKDIDIYIHEGNLEMKNQIMELIDAKDVELTDWGGLFFYESIFGNVDVFFDISDFDY